MTQPNTQFELTAPEPVPYIKAEMLAEALIYAASRYTARTDHGGPFSYQLRIAAELYGLASCAYGIACEAARQQASPHALKRQVHFSERIRHLDEYARQALEDAQCGDEDPS